MDGQVKWTLIVSAVAIPYVVEVLSQVPLLTRVVEALPADVRAALPAHPRRSRYAVFGSTRFFLALFRWALRDQVADDTAVRRLKRKMRTSAFREAMFGASLMVVVVLAWRYGWRPGRLFHGG